VASADVDHLDLGTIEVELVAVVKDGGGQDEFDAFEVVVFAELQRNGLGAMMQAREQ